MKKKERDKLKNMGYNLNQILEIEGFKFSFEVEYGQDMLVTSVAKLYDKFGRDYMAAYGMIWSVNKIHEKRGVTKSLDEIIKDLTENIEYYKDLIKRASHNL